MRWLGIPKRSGQRDFAIGIHLLEDLRLWKRIVLIDIERIRTNQHSCLLQSHLLMHLPENISITLVLVRIILLLPFLFFGLAISIFAQPLFDLLHLRIRFVSVVTLWAIVLDLLVVGVALYLGVECIRQQTERVVDEFVGVVLGFDRGIFGQHYVQEPVVLFNEWVEMLARRKLLLALVIDEVLGLWQVGRAFVLQKEGPFDGLVHV